jgi:hypothetical protein
MAPDFTCPNTDHTHSLTPPRLLPHDAPPPPPPPVTQKPAAKKASSSSSSSAPAGAGAGAGGAGAGGATGGSGGGNGSVARLANGLIEGKDYYVSELSVDAKFDLARSVGEECIQEAELRLLLEKKPHPIVYDGFEPSGRMHIAQGVMRAINVNKLTKCGCVFKVGGLGLRRRARSACLWGWWIE